MDMTPRTGAMSSLLNMSSFIRSSQWYKNRSIHTFTKLVYSHSVKHTETDTETQLHKVHTTMTNTNTSEAGSESCRHTQNTHITSAVWSLSENKPILKSAASCVFKQVMKSSSGSSSSQIDLNIYLWVLEPDELWLHKQIRCHSLQTC